ncbi:MAG: hypothetical protein OXC72_10455 [Roseovarius sp.]|nr:hypothetical protein [Roseovarius sp.]
MDDDVKPRPAATWASIAHCTENMLPRKDRTRGIQYRRQFRPTLCGDLQKLGQSHAIGQSESIMIANARQSKEENAFRGVTAIRKQDTKNCKPSPKFSNTVEMIDLRWFRKRIASLPGAHMPCGKTGGKTASPSLAAQSRGRPRRIEVAAPANATILARRGWKAPPEGTGPARDPRRPEFRASAGLDRARETG